METDYIIVYGLLKSMYSNPAARKVRKHCEIIGEGTFPGYLYDLGDYPGAVFDENSPYTVYGEVFKILRGKKELEEFLDDFEDVGPQYEQPNEYRKEIIPVQTTRGKVQAACYVYNRATSHLRLVKSGRYENVAGTRNKP